MSAVQQRSVTTLPSDADRCCHQGQLTSILFDEDENQWFPLPDKYYYSPDDPLEDLLSLGEEQAEDFEPQLPRDVCAVVAMPAHAAKLARNA